MRAMKVMTIVGARPQFIKSAPVSLAFQNAGIEEIVIHTGQHYDERMSAVFFEELGLPKPYAVLSCGNLPHVQMVATMMTELEPLIVETKPDYILVYGDTNSTLAGALTATKMRVPIVHVEAGLRSHNLDMPEEMNRILTDRMSAVLFTPTELGMENLMYEGYERNGCLVEQVGDVMYDALKTFSPMARWSVEMGPGSIFESDFAIATMHRFENVNSPSRLRKLVEEINEVHQKVMPVWMPVHPSTLKNLEVHGLKLTCYTAPPASYLQMLYALSKAAVVLTDSGGLQKEAYFSGVPCVTLRKETEWVELITLGVNTLFDPESDASLVPVVEKMRAVKVVADPKVYGDGHAAEHIAQTLLSTRIISRETT